MDNVTDHDDVLIHPAIRERLSRIAADRQMQFKRTTGGATFPLAGTAAPPWRVMEAMTAVTKAIRFIVPVQSALRRVSASPRCWNSGEVPDSREIEAAGAFLRTICTAVVMPNDLRACAMP